MFLEREKSETDDFKRKKTLFLKGKIRKNFNILRKYVEKCFNGYPCGALGGRVR